MATLFTVREQVDAALKRCGAFAPNTDDGSDPDDFSTAADLLDRMLSHYAATEKWQFMVSSDISIAIPANTTPIDIVLIAGTTAIPTGDFLAIKEIVLRKDGSDTPLERITRKVYEEKIQQKSSGGFPGWVYIDRSEVNPKVYLWPVLGVTGYELVFSFYRMSTTIVDHPGGSHGFAKACQLWMEVELAYWCGSGPVNRREDALLSRWQRDANMLREKLLAAWNPETKRPKRVIPWSF